MSMNGNPFVSTLCDPENNRTPRQWSGTGVTITTLTVGYHGKKMCSTLKKFHRKRKASGT
jgi:hypothetical protein